ncbi:hypothetical protein [Burkholderia stagnalis]|uniref:hypothetical protein n=1 Tax=Burkholderia stagnalis TaxID=1503054 RepID=UPI000F58098B|nr:hypothetical protein [Burkholderia stagnalis]RQQ65556.1 hypothetical protein DF137_22505 [Burkholderia stagnalis]RQQ78190.1 hypothetical protein DF138_21800 [Burkholderia stagnalis]RQQ87793.1 hypothetical protein DF136_21470 [Burkholderia stagnalis]
MSKAWDAALIKADSNHPDKGRAGLVVDVERNQDGTDKVLTIRLDELPDGSPAKIAHANAEEVTIIGVN